VNKHFVKSKEYTQFNELIKKVTDNKSPTRPIYIGNYDTIDLEYKLYFVKIVKRHKRATRIYIQYHNGHNMNHQILTSIVQRNLFIKRLMRVGDILINNYTGIKYDDMDRDCDCEGVYDGHKIYLDGYNVPNKFDILDFSSLRYWSYIGNNINMYDFGKQTAIRNLTHIDEYYVTFFIHNNVPHYIIFPEHIRDYTHHISCRDNKTKIIDYIRNKSRYVVLNEDENIKST
jgi:hypothetical protein